MPQASGVKEEYRFHTNEDYNNEDILKALENLKDFEHFGENATLPIWHDCSVESNIMRDNLTRYFNEQNQTYYRLWNIGKGQK